MSSAQIPVFVLNLRRSTSRRAHMREQLEALGLDYEIIHEEPGERANLERIVAAAHDGPLDEADAAIVDRDSLLRSPGWLIPGAIGATLSHNAAYRRIIDRSLERALVLEDDVTLSPSVGALARDFRPFEEVTEDSLFLLLSLFKRRASIDPTSTVTGHGVSAYRLDPSIERVGSSSAYVISCRTAARILEVNDPVRCVCDGWRDLGRAGAFNDMYVALPAPVRPSFAPSDLGYLRHGSRRARVSHALNHTPVVRTAFRARRWASWKWRSRYALR
ncbi:MAG: glycosyltransferase family 25 protein [Solirubrobacterales bacterium]